MHHREGIATACICCFCVRSRCTVVARVCSQLKNAINSLITGQRDRWITGIRDTSRTNHSHTQRRGFLVYCNGYTIGRGRCCIAECINGCSGDRIVHRTTRRTQVCCVPTGCVGGRITGPVTISIGRHNTGYRAGAIVDGHCDFGIGFCGSNKANGWIIGDQIGTGQSCIVGDSSDHWGIRGCIDSKCVQIDRSGATCHIGYDNRTGVIRCLRQPCDAHLGSSATRSIADCRGPGNTNCTSSTIACQRQCSIFIGIQAKRWHTGGCRRLRINRNRWCCRVHIERNRCVSSVARTINQIYFTSHQ